MKKIIIGVLTLFVLTGCSDTSKKEINTNSIFKEEMEIVSEIGSSTGKKLADELVIEDIELVFYEIFNYAIFENYEIEYGDITQGAGSDGSGKRIFCCKLPVNVKFIGKEASIKKFVEYFNGIENAVSFGDFKIETLEDNKYEVNTLINFLGKASGGSLSSGKKEYTIKKNEILLEEESDTVLRNFDVSMLISPSNSDAVSVSLGVGDKLVYNDENVANEIDIKFYNEGNKYFCEYRIGENRFTKAQIKPSEKILFDILSCNIIEDTDEIATNLHISNSSNKKVSIAIFDDEDERVNIVDKFGSVEVINQ